MNRLVQYIYWRTVVTSVTEGGDGSPPYLSRSWLKWPQMPLSNDAAMGTLRLLWLLPLLAAVEALYQFGPDLDGQLPTGEDVSQEVHLEVPIKFYGQTYQSIYVSSQMSNSLQKNPELQLFEWSFWIIQA